MTKKKKDDKIKYTATEIKQAEIASMMSKATNAREKNKHLIEKVKNDPELAQEVRETLCQDLRRVFEIPRNILGPSASRERYRQHGHFSTQLVTYLIGSWAEFKRQAKIEDSLGVKTVERNIAKTLRAQDVMSYADQCVKPWDGAYNSIDMRQEMVTLMVGSDFHSRFMDPFARRVWLEVAELCDPDGIRFNGDLVDFPQLSRHRQLPGHFALTVQDEINVAVELMRETRQAAPDSDMKFILGNHDIRLITALADAFPVFASMDSLKFNELFKLDELEVGLVSRASFLNPSAKMRKNDISQNWETLPDAYGNPFWTTVHGFLCGKNAPEKHLTRFMTNGTNGHLHNPVDMTGGSMATGVLQWFQTGCMAHTEGAAAGYMPGPIDAHGWATTFLVSRLFPRHGHVQGTQVHIGDVASFEGYYWEITDDERAQRAEMLEV